MIILVLAAFGLAAVLTPLLAAWAHNYGLLDTPNHRSLHVHATPRTGGIAVAIAVVAGCSAIPLVLSHELARTTQIVLAGAGCIALLGLADDVRPLPPLVRLPIQIAISAAVVAVIGPPALPGPLARPLLAMPLTIFWLVAFTNAYNFMDGIDGIAGGQAVVGGLEWAAVTLVLGSTEGALTGLIIAAASCGFLVHNWHPAKVFLGDAGSGFLGFLFAALPLTLPSAGFTLLVCGALTAWPFLFDTGTTLIRRAWRGENVLSAHRSHIYQRLIVSGQSHQRVALTYMGLALAGAAPALLLAYDVRKARAIAVLTVLLSALALLKHVRSCEQASGAGPARSESIR